MKPNAWLLATVFIIGMLLAVKFVLPYFTPFILGIILAIIIHPIVDRLAQLGLSPVLSSFLFVVLSFGGVILLVGLAISELWQELEQLLKLFEQIYASSSKSLLHIADGLPPPIGDLAPIISTRVSQFFITQLNQALGMVSLIPNAVLTFLIAVLSTYFISRDRPAIARFCDSVIPHRFKPTYYRFKFEVIHGLFTYLKAQTILVSLSTGLSILGFVVLGLPYAWLLGCLAGFLDLIPMIGPSGVFIPTIVYYLIYAHPIRAIHLGILWGIVLLIRQWWEPQLVGSQLGLHPLSSLVAIYLGVRLLGFVGFFVGPLVMICLKAFFVVAIYDQKT